MTWVRIDDRYATHRKMLQAGPIAMAVDISGLCYAAGHGTDGFIPTEALPAVAPFLTRAKALVTVGRLVEVGRWEPVKGGWRIHDFLAYNPSAGEREDKRGAAAERTRRWRDRKRGSDTSHGGGAKRGGDATSPSQHDGPGDATPPSGLKKPKGELLQTTPGDTVTASVTPSTSAASPSLVASGASSAAEPPNNGQPATAAQKAALRAALAPQPRELTAEEGRELFDQRARQFLGMSGEEFQRRYRAGELDENDDNVGRLAMLLPFAEAEDPALEPGRQDEDAEEVSPP